MEYTGVLEKDATKEEIAKAKKTVQVIIEIDGRKYVTSHDGTTALVVMATSGIQGTGTVSGDEKQLFIIVNKILDQLPQELLTLILAKRVLQLKP
ncbi:hypothetical protein [Acetonema longum]|uniref:Uncharacterized protein n=1 Tax=Acetonema longum DSM 6540 TaxID=1009370 RepID=F7NKE2_9FIRM|nr:hypothetical protein [Acetonema longum]EGO63583.1 hypothetical protein ALO_12776 [Acetonema longum DSM 6540]